MSIRAFISRFKYQHIATVDAKTDNTWNGEVCSTDVGSWMLLENGFGWRRTFRIGNAGGSAFAQGRANSVQIWRNGGPLPSCVSIEAERPKAQLILLEGGRS